MVAVVDAEAERLVMEVQNYRLRLHGRSAISTPVQDGTPRLELQL